MEQLNAQAVQNVLFHLSRLAEDKANLDVPLQDLLQKSVDQALKETTSPDLRRDIEKMRKALVQLSQGAPVISPTTHA